jgi:hypothetical protein
LPIKLENNNSFKGEYCWFFMGEGTEYRYALLCTRTGDNAGTQIAVAGNTATLGNSELFPSETIRRVKRSLDPRSPAEIIIDFNKQCLGVSGKDSGRSEEGTNRYYAETLFAQAANADAERDYQTFFADWEQGANLHSL